MALNIQFQNLNRANSEILKAFNSQAAAKALEAFQPLEAKERARAKLRALQRLKQESSSLSLADITISESALANALSQAEGAELQAMLNLLSAKMIEQNKNTILEFIDKKESKKTNRKTTKSKKQNKKNKKSTAKKKTKKKKDKKLVEEIVKSVEAYFDAIKLKLTKLYNGVLDAVSLNNLRKFFEDTVSSFKKYLYEIPVEFIDENVISPIYDFPTKLKEQIDTTIDKLSKKEEKRTFTAKEIRGILRSSIDSVREEFNDMLDQSIKDLDKNLKTSIDDDLNDKKWKPKVIVNESVKEVKKKIHRA